MDSGFTENRLELPLATSFEDPVDLTCLGNAKEISPLYESDGMCTICMNPNKNKSYTPCGHGFFFECLVKWSNIKRECPICRTQFYSFKYCPESGTEFKIYKPKMQTVPTVYLVFSLTVKFFFFKSSYNLFLIPWVFVSHSGTDVVIRRKAQKVNSRYPVVFFSKTYYTGSFQGKPFLRTRNVFSLRDPLTLSCGVS